VPKANGELTSRRIVSVIVLNWNGWKDSLACLGSLQSSVEAGLARVVIVDNASSDDSVLKLSQWLSGRRMSETTEQDLALVSWLDSPRDSDYVFIHARRNGGYAAGNNLGIRVALGFAETEYVFVLNNDTTVEPDSIEQLVDFAKRVPQAGIIGSTLIDARANLRVAGGCKYNRFLTTSTPVAATTTCSKPEIDFVTGAATFIRATALRQVGLFSEDYFLYFEELDFSRRITKAGFTITWCPESYAYHEAGQSAGSRSGSNTKKSSLAEYHSNLSCLIFMRKFHPRLLWLAAPVRFGLKIVHDLIRLELHLLLPLFKAYRDYLSGTRRHAT